MASGFRPFRYDCARQGCFNKKERLDFRVLFDALPANKSFTDCDGFTEESGNGLMIEWKSHDNFPKGQTTAFQNLSYGKRITTFCVVGDAETMTAHAMAKVYDGVMEPWRECTTDELKNRISLWSNWARKHSCLAYRSA